MLKQSTSLRPFVGEFIAFSAVTGNASNHHVVDIMTRGKFSTGNRNSVIEIIDIRSILALGKFMKAIIASILLGFQFGLDLLNCQRSFKILLADVVFLLSDALQKKILFVVTLIVLFLPSENFFMMDGAIARRICKHLFSVLLIIPFVVFRMSISIDLILLIFALFATGSQATSRVSMEELRSSGKPLQALRASLLRGIVLGYTVHTVRLQSLSSRLGMCQHRSGTTLLPLHYTIKPLHKQI